ncbi:MAG: outer membrane protein assembly factor BamE [Candidatus Omnitrophota bacterium]|jgi:outer membrane protein assembly factor BamE (lipoprotein component of BamABCDE complex)
MKRLINLIFMVLFLSGCMTFSSKIGEKEIDPQLIAKIQLNKTNKSEILEWFGNPHSISTAATGQEGYKYIFMETKSKVTPIPFNTKMSVDTKYQELNVMFKGDIVVDYSSTRR